MTLADWLVASLAAHGVRVAFGLPGAHTVPLYGALARARRLRHLLVRHEQGATFMADGYARATGRVGVALATTGPGLTNAATGLATACADGMPVLLLTSQIPSHAVGKGAGYFHEMDQLAFSRPITRFCARVERPEGAPEILREAFRVLAGPPPGPVHLEVPHDLFEQQLPAPALVPEPASPPAAPPDALEAAARALAEARRPLLLAGGGVVAAGATAEVAHLAERLGAPVLTTPMGKGAIPADHPLHAGLTWRAVTPDLAAMDTFFTPLSAQADCLVAVGCRFSQLATGNWRLPLPSRLVHIDADPAVPGRRYPPTATVVADARLALAGLLERLPAAPRAPWADLTPVPPPGPIPWVVAELRAALPREAIVAADITRTGYAMLPHFPVYGPRTFLHSCGFIAMGHAFPAALGAQVAFPERTVVAVAGDGGFLMTAEELATAVQEALPVVAIVMNDGALGGIRLLQEREPGARPFGVLLRNPDFAAFARAFGALGFAVGKRADFLPALREALAARRPAVLDVTAPPLET